MADMGITHPSCRLCILLADRQRRGERGRLEEQGLKRPCSCREKDTGEYHQRRHDFSWLPLPV
jgi:hypothetical protein